jgi:predicted anti-sigma-YlaC factor YlaD
MLTCKQASQFISASLDRPLSLSERLALKLHLLVCKYCKRFSQQVSAMRVALRTMVGSIENDNSIKMPSVAKDRITTLLNKTSG